MAKSTILDAVLVVLGGSQHPMSSTEIHHRIASRSLYAFKARDPIAIVRAAIQKHLRTHGGAAQPAARLRRVDRDRYIAI